MKWSTIDIARIKLLFHVLGKDNDKVKNKYNKKKIKFSALINGSYEGQRWERSLFTDVCWDPPLTALTVDHFDCVSSTKQKLVGEQDTEIQMR